MNIKLTEGNMRGGAGAIKRQLSDKKPIAPPPKPTRLGNLK